MKAVTVPSEADTEGLLGSETLARWWGVTLPATGDSPRACTEIFSPGGMNWQLKGNLFS